MFRNYCKTAIRNLLKNRTFSIINLTGLSLSVAFCLLLFFYIRHEQSYDSFHRKKDRLFRLEQTNVVSDKTPGKKSIFSFLDKKNADANNQLVFPLIAGRDLKNSFPEIKDFIRYRAEEGLIKADQSVYKENKLLGLSI